MPYKKVDPVPESEMDRGRYDGHFTICQWLRNIYHETNDSNIKYKLRVCMSMAKSMNKKLQYYKHKEQGIPPAPTEIREIQQDVNT